MDYFDINSEIVNCIIEFLLESMTLLYNHGLKAGILPDYLKIFKLISTFIKCDRNFIDNYKPISIIPIIAQIL